MSGSEYLEGCGHFAVMLLGCGLGALLVARLQPDLPPAARFVQVGVLWLCAILAVHLVPGVLGLLEPWAVSLASALLAGAAYLLTRRRDVPSAVPAAYPAAPESGGWSWLLAAVAATATVVAVAGLGLADSAKPPFHVDVTSFHLPNVARWIQSGTFWQVDDFIPDRSPGNYPQGGDVFSLAAMLPWSADFLVRFVNYPLLAVMATGVYGLVRELRVPAATAVTAAAAFTACPVVAWGAFAGLSDVAMLTAFAAGAYFLVRHLRTRVGMDLVLAGLALGLCFGTRWYAVPAVASVVVVWLGGRLAAGGDRPRVVRDAGVLTGLVTLVGGFWLLRNLVESGNPVFPVKVAPLGITLFDAPPDLFRAREGFTIAGYADQPSIWREYLLPNFLDAMGVVSVLLWIGLAGAGATAVALWHRTRRRAEAVEGQTLVVGGLVVAAALIGVTYTITPYSAVGQPGEPIYAAVNARYVMPALVLGVATTGWLIARTGRWRKSCELVLVLATFDGLRRVLDLPGPDLTARWIAITVAVLVAAAIAIQGVRAAADRGRLRAPVAAAVAALAAALLVGVGYFQERRFLDGRYAGTNPPAFLVERAPAGQRVGLVGEGWGNYPFFGPRLRNDVRFVGKLVDGTYRNYRRRDPFLAALRRGRYQSVVFHDYASIHTTLPRRQERWLREAGYRPLAEGVNPYAFGDRVAVYASPSPD